MKEFKGTPGEWVACDHGVGDIVVYTEHDQSAICSFDSDGGLVAWPSENYHVSGEAMANARIMAASKNLLEALQDAWAAMDRETACGSHLDTERHMARKAIAKALGEQQ